MSSFKIDGEYTFFLHYLLLFDSDCGHWLVNVDRLSCYSQVGDDGVGMRPGGLDFDTFCSWLIFIFTHVLVAFGGFFFSVDSSPICCRQWGIRYLALILWS